MSTMERILRLMADKKASDVYLAVNSPVLIKINGECIPINSQLLPVDGPRSLLAEIVTPRDMETLQETGELNIGVPLQGVGRFRISAMHQRGSIAVVMRYDPAKKVYQRQPEGGANTKHSELDFAYGLAWHENMWADTLG